MWNESANVDPGCRATESVLAAGLLKHVCRPANFVSLVCACVLAASVGCSEPPEFRLNAVEVRKQEIAQRLEDGESYPEAHLESASNLVTALFGTPQDPQFPSGLGEDYADLVPEESPVKLEHLQMASGAVSSDREGAPRGLYREHCVHCHGISGDGAGPTAAFLDPYPRDYRMGLFKFKSTPGGEKPSREDLRKTLVEGVPGTSMSSFHLLDEVEIEALIDYVIYLSIRGEVERSLLRMLPEEFDFDEPILAGVEDEKTYSDNLAFLIEEAVNPVIASWNRAESRVTPVPARPAAFEIESPQRQALIDRGRVLFQSADSGNCFSCHGYTGLGDGVTDNFDDWTKDWVEGGNVDLDIPAEVTEFVALGALPPRPIRPRNLRLGVYRGGRRPIDIYWRIKNGIKGSPMPGAAASMTDEDIWCLVEYVRQLPYEELSEPGRAQPTNTREVR